MNELSFAVFLLLPGVALAFVVLSTFYGPVNAYAGISWIPVTLALLLSVFLSMDYVSKTGAPDLGLLLRAVSWTSLAQALFGITLTIKTFLGKENWGLAAVATIVTVLPFLFIR
jgi:hypothetical protein